VKSMQSPAAAAQTGAGQLLQFVPAVLAPQQGTAPMQAPAPGVPPATPAPKQP
jgi:hypothetical protein